METGGGPVDAQLARRTDAHVPRVAVRRAAFVVLVVLTLSCTAWFTWNMIRVNGTAPLELAIFVLGTLLLIPIATSFWMSVFGFVVQLRGHDALAIDVRRSDRVDLSPAATTAIVVPAFEEDMDGVVARLVATQKDLARIGRADAFDVFVLSDTIDTKRWIEEEVALASAFDRFPKPGRVHYRNRAHNVAKKAGNIADFCQRHGDHYRYMIVFDADSVMSARTLVRLVTLMELRPDVGIIQAPPVPVNRRTLFGRLQQFAARVYGPTWSTGLAYLQGGEGNYYGHNAILRIGAFMEHCRLPVLPGEPPLGGHVLSHDFVEAALMRRGGYKVYLAPDLGGSFEEPPATLIDYTARDRRWCQGNLQHARLLRMRGLHPISRLHLIMGIVSYVSAPLWLLLLLLSTAEALRWRLAEHQYFASEGALFPTWEISVQRQASFLLATVMALLFVPRALAVVARLRDARERAQFGGGMRLIASAAGECIFSMLLAPVLAFDQTKSVISILFGRSVGWPAQPRDDSGTPWSQAIRRHAGATVAGALWAWLLLDLAPEFLPWMLPVVSGMLLSIFLSRFSSRVSVGAWARRRGLLLTPEETAPPAVLRAAREELARNDDHEPHEPQTVTGNALAHVLESERVRALHLTFAAEDAASDPLEQHALEGLKLKCRLHGPAALDEREQRALLHSPAALRELASSASRHPDTNGG